MRYYVWMEDDKSSPEYGKPYALFRVEVGTKRIIADWWNPEVDCWEHHPGLITIVDNYGAVNYHEVDGENLGSIKRTISKGWDFELN
ncbi:hypothetical protein [Methanococcoides methylutens]|nr:hypothetical protein [Methanococcoides methylutens]